MFFFFFNDTATTEIYTLSLHDALPIFVIHDVPANSTVVGNPGHPVRVEGKRPEGPDADWIHLPDPIADAIKSLADRLGALEGRLAELDGRAAAAEVRELKPKQGPSSAGG